MNDLINNQNTAWRAVRAIVASVTAKDLPEPEIKADFSELCIIWEIDEMWIKARINRDGAIIASYRYLLRGRTYERHDVIMRPGRFVDFVANTLCKKS